MTKIIQTLMGTHSLIFSNVAEGTHDKGAISFKAATAISQKFCFGALTSNANEIALAADSSPAIAVITDEAEEAGDYVAASIIGCTGSTMQVLAGGSIAIGDTITSDTNSTAVAISAQSAGTYNVYGVALKAASAGELVEFAPVTGQTETVS